MIHEELVKWDTLCTGTEVQYTATTDNCWGDITAQYYHLYIRIKRGQKISELGQNCDPVSEYIKIENAVFHKLFIFIEIIFPLICT